MNAFDEYNKYWREKRIKTPLVILIGGYIGTGKSTFAGLLNEKLDYINILPTGVIRSVAQSFTSPERNPELFLHTYKLDKLHLTNRNSSEENLIQGYKKQISLLEEAIYKMISFTQTEGQQYIIEGNHISVDIVQKYTGRKNIIPIFFKCSNADEYKQLVSGPTHQRSVSRADLKNIQILHDITVKEVELTELPIFEYNELEKGLKYIERKINELNKSVNS